MRGIAFRDFAPGDGAWIRARHAALYAEADGFDAQFGAAVAEVLSQFEATRDPCCERAFIPLRDGQPRGSLFCTREDAQTARLRLFLLEPEERGQGLGRHMLGRCVAFAREAGYARIVLSTHESHRAACALYARSGWRLVASHPVRSYGRDLVRQDWEMPL
ncbi:GNAT family N-acetyltransferase [Rhodosalinus halophilus]|uniref:GNAT family N-acetyltransferase n=1 Tax=Rhodosalinus halophilus TaxID=2259333 RepID=A0A365UBS4_9RHOB|nr:GNAT family N-acetyltransferase [Rhodosalinus halophilus]